MVLNQAVIRNIERFPSDFMFRLSKDNKTNIQELKQAIYMLIDRTKPAKIGFKAD